MNKRCFDLPFRNFGDEINQLYVEKQCRKAVGLARSLLATIKADDLQWNEMKSAGCGILFRTVKSCMIDAIPRLDFPSTKIEAKGILNDFINSECQFDNVLIHDDRLEAFKSASQLINALKVDQKNEIEKKVSKTFEKLSPTSKDDEVTTTKRNPRRNKRNTNDDLDILTNLLQKNSFDPATFMMELQIAQAKVTDLASASVSDLQDLLKGLTTNPTQG